MNEDVKSENLRIHSRADELIACLEGEIAKRDEELAACRVAVENCEVFRARIVELEDDLKCAHSMLAEVSKAGMALRAELSAIKAQEPVAEVKHGPLDSSGWPEFVRVKTIGDFDLENLPNGMKLYAAPVSEAKAQGVVMPEPLTAAITRADDVLHAISSWDSSSVKLEQRHGSEWAKEVDAIRRELHTQLARLNAAPVQQVSVPDGKVCVPVEVLRLYEFMAASFTPFTSQHEQIAISLRKAKAAMLAAPAAPAADAGGVLEQAMYTLISIGYHENSGLVHELRQSLAAHRSTGVV